MTVSRNEYQEKAMYIIYDALTYDNMKIDYNIKEVIVGVIDLDYDEVDLYVKEVCVKALVHKEEIITVLQEHMKNWTFARLNRVEQAILLLSVAHYKYVGEVDKAVVINIAIALAKKYLDDNDYKFVNAILDNVLC